VRAWIATLRLRLARWLIEPLCDLGPIVRVSLDVARDDRLIVRLETHGGRTLYLLACDETGNALRV
jgi:hypothetical protein